MVPHPPRSFAGVRTLRSASVSTRLSMSWLAGCTSVPGFYRSSSHRARCAENQSSVALVSTCSCALPSVRIRQICMLDADRNRGLAQIWQATMLRFSRYFWWNSSAFQKVLAGSTTVAMR